MAEGYDPVLQHFSHPHPLELTYFQHSLAPLSCAGCSLRATGWAYSCTPCGYHLHIFCASMPLSVSHHAHAHPLSLAFFPPYENHRFSCNICGSPGANHWLYRCAMCQFDAHLGCAMTRTGQRQQQQQQQQGCGVGGPQPQGMNGVGSGGAGRWNQAINGFVYGVGQQVGHILIKMFGGGEGGGDGGGGC